MLRITGWLLLPAAIAGILTFALTISLGGDGYDGPYYIGHNTGVGVASVLVKFVFGYIFALAARYLFTSKSARGSYTGLTSGVVGIVLFTIFQVVGIVH